jgi:hypothetical protein
MKVAQNDETSLIVPSVFFIGTPYVEELVTSDLNPADE